MKKIDRFIGINSVSKTLRFRAIPVGKTLENIDLKNLLFEDEERSENFKEVKKYMDIYHRFFIEYILTDFRIDKIDEYAGLFFKSNKSEDELKSMMDLESDMRKQISKELKGHKNYEDLSPKKLIEKILPDFLQDKESIEKVNLFRGFATAFEGFRMNRENIYSDEAKATAIGYRSVNENLPRFLSNIPVLKEFLETISKDKLEKIKLDFGIDISELTNASYFNKVLSQSGIDKYNRLIGGYFDENNLKIQGLNEYINLYNQQLSKKDKNKKLAKLKVMYKQILTPSESGSFYIDAFETDEEVIDAITKLYNLMSDEEGAVLSKSVNIFNDIDDYNLDGIYIKNDGYINTLSKKVTGDWASFSNVWNERYDQKHATNTINDYEKYDDKRRKAYKSIESFSLEYMKDALSDTSDTSKDLIAVYRNEVGEAVKAIKDANRCFIDEVNKHNKDLKIIKNISLVSSIKILLDELKRLQLLVKSIYGTGKEEGRDEIFYGEISSILDSLIDLDDLYNKTRNYLTKKPYSKEKYKLYFQNPQLLGGWDRNKESDYRSVLLRKDGNYYVAIIDKGNSKILDSYPKSNVDGKVYEKLVYKYLPDPSKMLPKVFFSKKGLVEYTPSAEILRIKNSGSFKKGEGFNLEDCRKLIGFYIESIKKHPDWSSSFDFSFKKPSEYSNISEFYNDVVAGGYKIYFDKIDEDYINDLVEQGSIYLFKLYNKDFSEKSHGTPNLHTLYFLNAFSKENIADPVIKLNGGAELFYRKKSIPANVTHPANVPIKTKNPDNPRKEVTFEYDIIKDKRFSENQFMFHVPITINYNPYNNIMINDFVRKELKKDENPYIIGIDRGERNLLYVCVIDGTGKIVEQMSLNEIVNEFNNGTIKVDYHQLLDNKERERLEARQNWRTIENIKELKEGYISQVVYKICQLVLKYDAIIAIENLNSGFKNSRIKVEKQVYQKFEKMLIEKLNYLVDKKREATENGGVLKGYQLTNPFKSFKTMGVQNGFIFYIPAWLTSKIDPLTGFADLLKPKYKNIDETKAFISSFESIKYVSNEDMFAFEFDYSKFIRTDADYKKKWTIYSNGSRIYTFRNSEKNNQFDNVEVCLTDEFKTLFSNYGIDIEKDNLIEDITGLNDATFYKEFYRLLRLVLQMRNSITGKIDVDYLISPVKDENGNFFDSRDYENQLNASLPANADANGAFNIARKALWAVNVLKETEDEKLSKVKISITNKDWLKFAQER